MPKPENGQKGNFNARLWKLQRTKSGNFDRTTARMLQTGHSPFFDADFLQPV
jgi:hypothetical protein